MAPAATQDLLRRLADPARQPLPARALVVVAHPDDEVIGIGTQLHRFPQLRIAHVTDGAPRRGGDVRRAGFARAQDYAAARRDELACAVALAGVPETALEALGVPDQEVASNLGRLVDWLAALLPGVDVVFTHAYEGGHPDHDATAFAVHRAATRRLAPPALVEMPSYRGGPAGAVWQDFAPRDATVAVEVRLSPAEQERKRRMLACFATQARTLEPVSLQAEWFRAAEGEDFSVLPNGGDVLYERYGWGITGDDLLRAFAAFAEGGGP